LSYMASLSLEHLYGEEEGRELANQGWVRRDWPLKNEKKNKLKFET
jgi:hypothetical protein